MTSAVQLIDDQGRVQGYAEGDDLTVIVEGDVTVEAKE